MSMGEQIKRYQTSFCADDDVVLASDHEAEIARVRAGFDVELHYSKVRCDAEIAQRDARIGELIAERDRLLDEKLRSADARIWELEKAITNIEIACDERAAERDTAREMLRVAVEAMSEFACADPLCCCGLCKALAEIGELPE
jgi:hypothetical protein